MRWTRVNWARREASSTGATSGLAKETMDRKAARRFVGRGPLSFWNRRVEAELLLLDIARARHYRPVHFTAVSSVVATFEERLLNPCRKPVPGSRAAGFLSGATVLAPNRRHH